MGGRACALRPAEWGLDPRVRFSHSSLFVYRDLKFALAAPIYKRDSILL